MSFKKGIQAPDYKVCAWCEGKVQDSGPAKRGVVTGKPKDTICYCCKKLQLTKWSVRK